MSQGHPHAFSRRGFLHGCLALAAAPLVVPGRVLGRDGGVAPSNRIVFGGIGIGNRARYILPNFLWFPEMQWVLGTDATGPVEFETSDIVWPDPVKFMSETALIRLLAPDGTIFCFYGRSQKAGFAGDRLTLARFNLEWLTGKQESPK